MHADLDTLCTVVCRTADDLLPEARKNARRRLTDAAVVTLREAPAIMGIPSDRRLLAVARRRLVYPFPCLPSQACYVKRRRRLTDTVEWLLGVFASASPHAEDELLLVDSTPVPCAASRETVKRSALANLADYGCCAFHSHSFWDLRLHALCAPTARRGRSPWPRRSVMGVRSASSCWRAAAATVSCSSATRATPAGGWPRRWPPSAPLWCARRARPRPEPDRTWRRSASASSRSLRRQRTCSPWSATGRVPWPACVSASWHASFASRPASDSTTGLGLRVVPSSTTAPEAVGVESIIQFTSDGERALLAAPPQRRLAARKDTRALDSSHRATSRAGSENAPAHRSRHQVPHGRVAPDHPLDERLARVERF